MNKSFRSQIFVQAKDKPFKSPRTNTIEMKQNI